MSASQNSQRFCVFCLKTKTSCFQSENISCATKQFFTCFTRFIGNKPKHRLHEELSQKTSSDLLKNCCRDCQSFVINFCEVYSEMKYLELQLEWKLEKLIKIMKLGSRVPSRVSSLNTTLDQVYLYDKEKSLATRKHIHKFRQTIIKAGCHKLRASQPRVLLKKHENVFNNDIGNPIPVKPNNHTPRFPDQSFVSTDSPILRNALHTVQKTVDQSTKLNNNSAEDNNEDSVLSTNPNDMVTYYTTSIPNADLPENVHIVISSACHNLADFSDTGSSSETSNEDDVKLDEHDDIPKQSESNTGAVEGVKLQMKFDDDCDNLPQDVIYPQTLEHHKSSLQPSSFVVENASVELASDNDRSSAINNKFYCSLCKKKFKSANWLGFHNKRFHPDTSSFRKPVVVTPDPQKILKTESDTSTAIPTTSKDQQRYNLRENRTPKYLQADESESDDNGDDQRFTEYTSESSSSSNESEIEIERQEIQPKPIISKHNPPKQKVVKLKRKKVDGSKCFRCETCKLAFSKRRDLNQHIIKNHRFKGAKLTTNETDIANPPNQPDQESFKCNFCEIVMEYASDLAIHEIQHASVIITNDGIETKTESNKYSQCPRCTFKYFTCKKVVYIRHHLKTHLKISAGNDAGACKMCTGGNVYVPNSKSHFNLFHNADKLDDPSKLFKCDICQAFFIKAKQLYRHKYRIHDQNNHKCEICDKTFLRRDKMIEHKHKFHKKWDEDPNLPIGCDREGCKKRFKCEGEFESHKQFHHFTTQFKYAKEKCLQCIRVFKSKDLLTAHINHIHCKQICPQCGKRFKSAQNLSTHLKYHKNPNEWKFECTECGKKCADEFKLEQHTRTHTKEKPYICQFCGEKYAHRHNWRNHLKMKHGDKEEVMEEIKRKTWIERAQFMSRKGSKKGDCIIAGSSTKTANNTPQ